MRKEKQNENFPSVFACVSISRIPTAIAYAIVFQQWCRHAHTQRNQTRCKHGSSKMSCIFFRSFGSTKYLFYPLRAKTRDKIKITLLLFAAFVVVFFLHFFSSIKPICSQIRFKWFLNVLFCVAFLNHDMLCFDFANIIETRTKRFLVKFKKYQFEYFLCHHFDYFTSALWYFIKLSTKQMTKQLKKTKSRFWWIEVSSP